MIAWLALNSIIDQFPSYAYACQCWDPCWEFNASKPGLGGGGGSAEEGCLSTVLGVCMRVCFHRFLRDG